MIAKDGDTAMARLVSKLLKPLGYRLVDHPPIKPHWRQLVALLAGHGVSLVLDVGANTGQYASRLRRAGWGGRMVSFEPQAAAHAELRAAAANDPAWQVAPPLALGAEAGETVLHVSNESDMSSLLEMRPEFLATSPTSAIVAEETVRVITLEAALAEYAGEADRVFVKIDTQGSEAAVLDGAGDGLRRVVGLQLELSLVPLYEGETTYRAMIERLGGLGFAPYLLIPGYFSRHMGRMLQFDGVFFRPDDHEEGQ